MKLATSTGDFSWYVPSTAEQVQSIAGTKFKYINLEQTGNIPTMLNQTQEAWKVLAHQWGEIAAAAGVTYVVSHAPCLHFPVLEAMDNPQNETYRANIQTIRRSIEICHLLNIPRIVVHACPSNTFSKEDFYRYNSMFYREFFDLMEKYNIMVLTENWDNNQTQFSTGKEIREFLDYMDHPLLAACWDTAHGNIDPVARELSQYENILAIGDKLKGVHISDNFGDCHHHSWPFAGIINFDSVLQGLLDVKYDGFFTFEASYTLLHHNNIPYHRQPWNHQGQTVTKLLDPSLELKQKAVDLLYDIGKYLLDTYNCFEE
jgi:sugar phosphate isomerase/epimerase